MIDVDAVRADTPATKSLIHLNSAGSSLPPTPVVDAVHRYVDAEAGLGGYEAAEANAEAELQFYDSAARLLNCNRSEVAFTVSASDAWWRAFLSVPLEPGDRVLIGRAEYIANAYGLIQAKARGIDVELIDDDDNGQISLDALADALGQPTKLVCLTHVPTSSGLINPAAEVGALARGAGAWFLLDACQSAGQMPLDVEALGCDFLSLTGRKFLRGPRGTGLLFARGSRFGEMRPAPFIDGRSAQWTSPWEYQLDPSAKRFELFEVNYAAKFGFGAAIDYALNLGLDHIGERVSELAATFRDGLDAIEGITTRDQGVEKCGIVTFTVDGHAAEAVQARLRANGINVSMSRATMAQFDLGHRRIPEVVRASPHYFNTEAELAKALSLLRRLRV